MLEANTGLSPTGIRAPHRCNGYGAGSGLQPKEPLRTIVSGHRSIYDIIVVGAGHAGCEAALAAARMGCKVLLLAIDLDKVASMPCSPSIGGMAKGQLVREIDALGGEMAKITDRSAIQYRILNTKKGPAVHSSRTQNDKKRYHAAMKSVVEHQPGLELKQALVERLVLEEGVVAGVEDQTGFVYPSRCVVLATGTFLSGLVHVGSRSFPAGRAGEFASYALAEQLKDLSFSLGRMKTGTPPRLKRSSIDFSRFTSQDAETTPRPFSHFTQTLSIPQLPSYLGKTNPATHRIVRDNLERSALYGGRIHGVSARYCPSFEDKIVKFSDRDHHPVILEPEGLDTEEVYASGLGNSLPLEIQIDVVRSVDGLESAEIMRPAYAIEYDFVDPIQLKKTLETKKVTGLFMAGQINGTSGYEEAAAQGLWAGINAACQVQGRPAFVLDRSQAYMGVMVDDLVTRGTREPYRMFTSRAEYRLMLREDNADLRLMHIGHELGLIGDHALKDVQERRRQIAGEMARIRTTVIKPSPEFNAYLQRRGSSAISTGMGMDRLLKRAELDYDLVRTWAPPPEAVDPRVVRQVEIELKYEGYIQRQLSEIEKFRDVETTGIPEAFDYSGIHGLSNEIREKLTAIRPASLGQASRIDGMTPAALSILLIALRARRGNV